MSKSKSGKSKPGISKEQLAYLFRANGWETVRKDLFHYPETTYNAYLTSTSLKMIRAIKNKDWQDDIQLIFDRKYKELHLTVVKNVLKALNESIKRRVGEMKKNQGN